MDSARPKPAGHRPPVCASPSAAGRARRKLANYWTSSATTRTTGLSVSAWMAMRQPPDRARSGSFRPSVGPVRSDSEWRFTPVSRAAPRESARPLTCYSPTESTTGFGPSRTPRWLDICPSSNVRLGVVPGLGSHPIDALLRAGVCVSVNTDDPVLFDTDLVHEYVLCIEQFGWLPSDVEGVARASIESSFASPELKSRLLGDLSSYASTGWS
jgi:hypothetical protein